MAKLAKTFPNMLRDVDTFKNAIKDRRNGMSLADISVEHYRNKTNLPAALRKCRDIVDNPEAAKEDKDVAKRVNELWEEASNAGGKRAGGNPAKMTAAKSKELLEALKNC